MLEQKKVSGTIIKIRWRDNLFSYGNLVTCLCDRTRRQKWYWYNEIRYRIKTVLCLIKVNSNTVELTVNTSYFSDTHLGRVLSHTVHGCKSGTIINSFIKPLRNLCLHHFLHHWKIFCFFVQCSTFDVVFNVPLVFKTLGLSGFLLLS